MTEKTCNEFIKEMRDAGFDFTFVATNDDVVIRGNCSLDPLTKELVIKSKRQLTAEQLKTRINERLKDEH